MAGEDWAKKALTESAGLLVNRARPKAKTQAIKDGFKIDPAKDNGDYTYSIRIVNVAKEAAAYEFGSGIHRTRGTPAKYPIYPKNKKALAFDWNPETIPWGSPKFIGIGADGRMLFKFVQHPGVAPVPFMKPAFDESKDEIRAKLKNDFVVNVIYKRIKEVWESANVGK